MDCLDRTNAFMTKLFDWEDMWIRNGNALSQLYAGTSTVINAKT